jgi:hypothetical protein
VRVGCGNRETHQNQAGGAQPRLDGVIGLE